MSDWLLGECYSVVGDGAETAALVLDQLPSTRGGETSRSPSGSKTRILPLRQADAGLQQQQVIGWLRELDRWERFTLLKLLTGELRVGVSQTLVVPGTGRRGRPAGDHHGGAVDGRLDADADVVRRR